MLHEMHTFFLALRGRILEDAVGVGGLPGRLHPLVRWGSDPRLVHRHVVGSLDSRVRHWVGASKLYFYSSCERSWSHEPAPMPRSLGSCPVPIVASMCALSMSFACASEKMPMCRGLCYQKRGVRRWRTRRMLCGGSCVCIRTYGTSLLYSRVCTHTKTVLNLNDAPETLLYRQARSAVVGAERAVLIGPVRGLQWSKM